MKRLIIVFMMLVIIGGSLAAQEKSLANFQELITSGQFNKAGNMYINDDNPPMYVDINLELGPIYSNEFRWMLRTIGEHITGVEVKEDWLGVIITTDIPHRFTGKTHTPSDTEYYVLLFIEGVDGLEINEVKFTPTK